MTSHQDPEIMVREPMVEGIFYPEDKAGLTITIQDLLAHSKTVPGNAWLIVSPHGSFEFSGSIMAEAYRAAATSTPQRIIIIGTCFHKNEPAIFLPESSLFRTPLGDSPVDCQFIEDLLSASTINIRNDLPHLEEHSIEVQLPFIQYLFPNIPIVPILLGNSSDLVFKALIAGLTISLLNTSMPSFLLVISSNLSAVLNRTQAHRESEQILDLMISGHHQEILAAVARKEISGENAAALAVVAHFSIGRALNIVARGSSLPVQYDLSNVVEYAALALF